MEDNRIAGIKEQLLRYTVGDYSSRQELSEAGDEIDAIIVALNTLGEEMLASGKSIRDYEQRISNIMEVLLKYIVMDFSEKAPISNAGDEIDAIAVGLNTLGEELEAKNIAERKYAQDLEKLAIVLETTADAITTTTPEGIFVTWNKSAELIYGYTAGEMIGKRTSTDLILPAQKDEFLAAINRAKNGDRIVDYHVKSLRKDGSVIDISMTVTPVRDTLGEITAISSISRDVTEQKRMEMTLRENEERFRLIVESVRDYAIFMIDPEGYITSWNKGAQAIKGYSAEEAIGKHISLFYTADELERDEPSFNLKMAKSKGRFETEAWRVRKDGSLFWADVLLTALYNEKGELKGFSKVTRDITERKAAEKQIRRLNRELEQNIIMLQESNSELEAFTYSVSHDLRAPLRAIHGYTRVLSKDYTSKLDEEAQSMMEAVMHNAKKMGQLIDDLLALSRLGRKELQKRPLDMNALVGAVVGDLRKSIASAEKTEIIIHDLPEAEADFSLITQVFSNLIGNGIKYSSLRDHPRVEVGAKDGEGEYIFYVKDNGAGFDMKYYDKLFGVFQRLHDMTEFEGTGVGLAIVKRIIVKHEGRVWAEAKEGEGATFYFSLNKK